MQEEKNDEFLRLVKWLEGNLDIQHILMDCSDQISTEEILDILDRLAGEKFYEMVYVFVVHFAWNRSVGSATERFIMQMVMEESKRSNGSSVYGKFRELMLEEMKRLEERYEQ